MCECRRERGGNGKLGLGRRASRKRREGPGKNFHGGGGINRRFFSGLLCLVLSFGNNLSLYLVRSVARRTLPQLGVKKKNEGRSKPPYLD